MTKIEEFPEHEQETQKLSLMARKPKQRRCKSLREILPFEEPSEERYHQVRKISSLKV